MSNSFFTKLVQRGTSQVDDAKHFIYTHSKWLDEEQEVQFQILLTTNNQSYKGATKFAELRNAAEELHQPYDEFYNECKKALSTDMVGFDYELSCNEDPPLFKLYKCQGGCETSSSSLYMEVELHKISNCFELLDAAIASNKHRQILAEYKQYVEESKIQETKLLKKFILLINNKKSRIVELERQLEEALDQKADETDVEPEPPEEGEKAATTSKARVAN